jgi:hypothetical protein
MSVLSARVRPNMGSRLTVYFRPVGYDQPPNRTRPGELVDDGRRVMVMP